jgi:hypothetical protein
MVMGNNGINGNKNAGVGCFDGHGNAVIQLDAHRLMEHI